MAQAAKTAHSAGKQLAKIRHCTNCDGVVIHVKKSKGWVTVLRHKDDVFEPVDAACTRQRKTVDTPKQA